MAKKQARAVFSEEERNYAVAEVLKHGRSPAEVAKEMGAKGNTIYNWVAKEKASPAYKQSLRIVKTPPPVVEEEYEEYDDEYEAEEQVDNNLSTQSNADTAEAVIERFTKELTKELRAIITRDVVANIKRLADQSI